MEREKARKQGERDRENEKERERKRGVNNKKLGTSMRAREKRENR